MGRALAALLLATLAAACGDDPHARGAWVDLSHPLDTTTLYWPTGSPFELEQLARGEDDAGRWYAANRLRTPEHLGTHLDAPFHFARGGWTSLEIPLARMTGPAFVLDVSAAADADRALAIPDTELDRLEQRLGHRVPAGSTLLIRTGWDRYWSDRERYFGSGTQGDASDLHFPGRSERAAEWITARGLSGVGIDTASIDPGPSRNFEAHRVLSAANVLIYENLRGLERLPERGARFWAFSLPVRSGTGGPVRAVARLPHG